MCNFYQQRQEDEKQDKNIRVQEINRRIKNNKNKLICQLACIIILKSIWIISF